MTAFNAIGLWNKSKLFLDRALRGRDSGDLLEQYLSSAVALELLGKACLATVSPSLVADPNHFPSLLAAAGRGTPLDTKSITAKTLYERLHTVADQFDERLKRECLLMAERRNAELHSGESPTQGLSQAIWVPAFWRAASVLIEAQGRTLEEWTGVEEGARVREILRDAAEVTRQGVLARIARRRADYIVRVPVGSTEEVEARFRANARPLPDRFSGVADAYEEHPCPSCLSKAWLFGFEGEEEVLDIDPADIGFGPPVEVVRTTYSVEEFRCAECGLVLEGVDEIHTAALPREFSIEDYREASYEEEYGNE